MTTKTLSGIYSAAYNLTSPVTTLSIAASGYLGGGLLAAGTGTYTIVNHGEIHFTPFEGPAYGVSVAGAGIVTNTGTIFSGVGHYGAGTGWGVVLGNGGAVTNGSAAAARALIEGYYNGIFVNGTSGKVVNDGTIIGRYHFGVALNAGGTVTNGAGGAGAALIEGDSAGIEVALGGAVHNYGTVVATGTAATGIDLTTGGAVTNGSATDTAAKIEASGSGVLIQAAPGTVTNFGSVLNTGAAYALNLTDGGVVMNGIASDTVALIGGAVEIGGAGGTVDNFGTIGDPAGARGVVLLEGGAVTNGGTANTGALIEAGRMAEAGVGVYGHSGTVKNFGTIAGGYYCVWLDAGGRITNGGATDTSALIQGVYGAFFRAAGTLTNYGTITGAVLGGAGAALFSSGGGRITNGSDADRTALISGHRGVRLLAGTVINNGTIAGNAASGSLGVYLNGGAAAATNGSATNAAALITGYVGVAVAAGSTLTNFGTVAGMGGDAVTLADPTSRLNAEAGSVFKGQVAAGGGTVDVVSGTATMSGGLSASGPVEGLGTLKLTGGVSQFSSALTVAIVEAGASTIVAIETTLTTAKVWTQTAGELGALTGDRINFDGVGDSFAGTLTGPGTIAITGGTDTLTGTTLSASTMIVSNATVTLSGAIDLTQTLSATTAHLIVAAGGATLSGGGTLALSNTATNKIAGASSASTLTNFDMITGAGQLGGGSMALVNKAGGVINGDDARALVINTGTATTTNAGIIECTSSGGVTITGAVASSGSLTVTAGTLLIDGPVSGAGTVQIGGGTAHFVSTLTENVAFTGTTGVLELAKSVSYAGSISGFSKTGTTSLDLLDIGFVSGTTKASFSGTTTAGTLTVTDGTHTAEIHLTGNYTASTWTLSSDGHGGTTVIDPTPSMQPLISAMAGFGGGAGAPAPAPAVREPAPFALLVRPA
jgi:hypothetical protein